MDRQLFDAYGIRQLGYYVNSIEQTARRFSETFGAGPFVDMGASLQKTCKVRGIDQPVLTRCALGQLGDMQIELIERKSECPDPYEEMGHFGLHHVCIWADDVEGLVEKLQVQGMSIAMELVSTQGLHVYYLDAREQFGHYVEINAPMERLWNAIAAVHENWLGNDALIGMDALMKMMQ